MNRNMLNFYLSVATYIFGPLDDLLTNHEMSLNGSFDFSNFLLLEAKFAVIKNKKY